MIFAWNEFFLAVQLNPTGASTMPVWVNSQQKFRGQLPRRTLRRIGPRHAARSSSPAGSLRSA